MEEKTNEHQERQQEEQEKREEPSKQGKPERPEKADKTKEQKEPDKPTKEDTPDEKDSGPPLLDEPIRVKDYIYLNMLTLEGKAWAYMDLIAHPETQKHQKDMVQAKLAIDTIDALYKIIEEHLTSDQRKDLQTRLTNLRLNFVK